MAKKKAATPKKPGGESRKRAVDTKRKAAASAKGTKKAATKRKRPGQKKRRAAKRKAVKAPAATASATTSPDDTPAPTGGQPSSGAGGVSTLSRSDMVAVGSALRQRRVAVRDDVVEASLNRAGRIALASTKERNALAATRLLLTAVQINQQDEHKGMPDKIQLDARVMTIDGQRAALLAVIASEKKKRAATKAKR